MNFVKSNINLYINYIALAYAFTLPLSRAGIVFFSVLFILLWFIEGKILSKLNIIIKHKLILAIFIFILWNFISLLWSDELGEGLKYIKRYWYLFPLLVLLSSLKKEFIPKILSAFIMGMFVSEIISYGIFFELWHFKGATPQNPSPFMHHIEYSVFLALTALILLGRMFHEENIKYKLIYFAFFSSIIGNLFLNAGRTGQLAFLVGLFVLVLLNFKNKFKAFVVFSTLSILIITIAYNFSQTFHQRVQRGQTDLLLVMEKQNYCTSWGGRVGAWILSKDIIVSAPVLGVGLVDNMTIFHENIDKNYPKMQCMHKTFMHVHNQFLQILTQLGIIGLFSFLMIFYFLGKLSIKNREYYNIQFVYLSLLMFAFLPEVLFHRQFSLALFTLIVGLLLAEERVEREEASKLLI